MVAKGRVVVSPLVQCLPSVVPKIIDGVSQSQPKQILHDESAAGNQCSGRPNTLSCMAQIATK